MWTDKDEQRWREATARREASLAELGKYSMTHALRELADRIDKGHQRVKDNLEVEFVRQPQKLLPGPGPVVALKVSVVLDLGPEDLSALG